jgi:hypothetical protein
MTLRSSNREDTHGYDPARIIMAGDYADRSILSCATFHSTMAHHRRESLRQAHASGACFSGIDEASTQNQRLMLILIEAFLLGRGYSCGLAGRARALRRSTQLKDQSALMHGGARI